MLSRIGDEVGDIVALLRNLFLLGAIAAVYKELRTPPAQRTWNGRLFNVIPYDFRVPSVDRLRNAYWNPDSDTVFTDRPIGVGWAVNLPPLLRRVGLMSERRPTTAGTRGSGGAPTA
ncbi:MAG: hypothetical protein M3295_09280 [Chloroflexota bacterium]|nr:hypothetical protein [Chloroflexota bacterium]